MTNRENHNEPLILKTQISRGRYFAIICKNNMSKIENKIKSILKNLIEYGAFWVGLFPSHYFRLFYYRAIMGMKIGKYSSIHRGAQIRNGKGITIGDNCVIGEYILLDGRNIIQIGNNVNISSNVSIYTMQHDYNDPYFSACGGKVIIGNNAWISSDSTILPNVNIGEGAVVGARSLVTKDVNEYTLVGGVPARYLKDRNRDIRYRLNYKELFF